MRRDRTFLLALSITFLLALYATFFVRGCYKDVNAATTVMLHLRYTSPDATRPWLPAGPWPATWLQHEVSDEFGYRDTVRAYGDSLGTKPVLIKAVGDSIDAWVPDQSDDVTRCYRVRASDGVLWGDWSNVYCARFIGSASGARDSCCTRSGPDHSRDHWRPDDLTPRVLWWSPGWINYRGGLADTGIVRLYTTEQMTLANASVICRSNHALPLWGAQQPQLCP